MPNYVFFEGTVKWVKARTPDKFNKYTIDLYPDAETRKAIKATGARLSLKEGEDGFYYTFRRATELGGRTLSPPTVVDADGAEFDGNIGNGSKAIVKLELYEYKGGVGDDGKPYNGGKALRWEGIKILELVEYKKPEGDEVASTFNDTSTALPF